MASIFDIIKRITVTKDEWKDIPEEEKQTFNNWMCNRILSMNEDYVEVVNIVQKNTFTMKGEHLYNLYKDIIPKRNVFLKYIKVQNKKTYNDDEVTAVSSYYEMSRREAKEVIEILTKEHIKEIMAAYGK